MSPKPTRLEDVEPDRAPLPAERAFVVQLRDQTDPSGEFFVGRAEHMASGAAERFTSSSELLAFMKKALAARR